MVALQVGRHQLRDQAAGFRGRHRDLVVERAVTSLGAQPERERFLDDFLDRGSNSPSTSAPAPIRSGSGAEPVGDVTSRQASPSHLVIGERAERRSEARPMAYSRRMADQDFHAPKREIVELDDAGNLQPGPANYGTASAVIDPLLAFYWARLDEHEHLAREASDQAGRQDLPSPRLLDDLAAKKAVLDDYARHCADLENPARELICRVTRDVIKRLAAVYAGHPDYDPAWRP